MAGGHDARPSAALLGNRHERVVLGPTRTEATTSSPSWLLGYVLRLIRLRPEEWDASDGVDQLTDAGGNVVARRARRPGRIWLHEPTVALLRGRESCLAPASDASLWMSRAGERPTVERANCWIVGWSGSARARYPMAQEKRSDPDEAGKE